MPWKPRVTSGKYRLGRATLPCRARKSISVPARPGSSKCWRKMFRLESSRNQEGGLRRRTGQLAGSFRQRLTARKAMLRESGSTAFADRLLRARLNIAAGPAFLNSRLVPGGGALAAALAACRRARRTLPLPSGEASRFFAAHHGGAIPLAALESARVLLREHADVRNPPQARWQPRLHDLHHYSESRIIRSCARVTARQPRGINVTGDSTVFLTRNNPVVFPSRRGHRHETPYVDLRADLKLKEAALAKTTPTQGTAARCRPDDELPAFLNSLCLFRVRCAQTQEHPPHSTVNPESSGTRNNGAYSELGTRDTPQPCTCSAPTSIPTPFAHGRAMSHWRPPTAMPRSTWRRKPGPCKPVHATSRAPPWGRGRAGMAARTFRRASATCGPVPGHAGSSAT